MRPFTTGLGLCALTCSLLLGCGGDDEAATTLREGEASEGAGDDDANPLDGGDDGDDANPLDGEDDGDDQADGGGDADAFCSEAAGIEERFAALDDAGAPSVDQADQFAEVSGAFEDLAEDAPDEIADDMDAIAGAMGALAEVFGRIDLEDPESLAALQEESTRLEEEFGDLDEAGANVEEYFQEECGIDLGGDDADDVEGGSEGEG